MTHPGRRTRRVLPDGAPTAKHSLTSDSKDPRASSLPSFQPRAHGGAPARDDLPSRSVPTPRTVHVLETIHKTLHLLRREQRGRWVALVGLAIVASGLEMMGALLVYLLLALVADPASSPGLPLVGNVREFTSGVDDTTVLLMVAAVVAVFFVTRAVFQTFVAYAQQRIAHNAGARLSRRLTSGYLLQPYSFHLRRATADLIRTGHQAVIDVVTRGFLPLINVTASVILVIGMVVIMVLVAPLATAMAVVVVGSAALILLRVVQPRFRNAGESTYEELGATLRSLQQALQGIRDIKLLGRDRYFAEQYGESRDRLSRAYYTHGTLAEMPRHVMETSLVVFILVFFATAVLAGAATEEVVSVLGLFAYAGLRLQPSLYKMVGGLNELKYSSAAIDAIEADLGMAESVLQRRASEEESPPLRFERELRLEHVTFGYEQGDRPALVDVDLTIVPGQVVGVCGPTGGGKSTLIDLVTGLLDPVSGRVCVDGEDVHEHPQAWQRDLGVVPQLVFLVDDTLRRNIALGIPDEAIDHAAIAEAVRLAQLDEVVAALPDGLDTVVGEQGIRLSGGQRQRVAIARALYGRPDVLLFDEGTSALDNTTEAQLMGALAELRGRHTIILVAHRLSTVRDCDLIILVAEGRVAGLGTYDELLESNRTFQELARATA
jgi:ATP-binding cassette, subfamily B, bacterial PglK